MILLIELLGYLLICVALVHVIFPRYFHWKEELARLSLINRQIMEVHTFFITLMVFLMGLLNVTSAELLMTTTLGRRLCLGMAVFWGCRLYCQFFWYSPELWKGKKFETVLHVLFALLWCASIGIYLTAAFAS